MGVSETQRGDLGNDPSPLPEALARTGRDVKIAVLGSGPAGVMAAWACLDRGITPDIYTRNRGPSQIHGAQYLHIPIPNITDHIPSTDITYVKRGTADGYSMKLYRVKRRTSWDRWPFGIVKGWPLKLAYSLMYYQLEKLMWEGTEIDEWMAGHLIEQYDLVISTVPPIAFCQHRDRHTFRSAFTWIAESDDKIPPWTIIYNGEADVPWHRASNLEGKIEVEFGVPVVGAWKIQKPQSTDCDCFPDLLRVGRMGLWTRDVLASDAFTVVHSFLSDVA